MRPRLLIVLFALAIAAICTPVLAAAATHSAAKKTPAKKTPAKKAKKHKKAKKKGLTASDIRAAVAIAERSPDLWATVNVCNSTPSTNGDTVGIRGQMPGLGFTATMDMKFSVSYWNYSDNLFEPVANATEAVSLHSGARGLHQTGVNFPFTPPAAGTQYLVRGTITFEWRKGSKVLGEVARNTGHGYANVADSSPPGLNEGTCTLTPPPATTPTTTTPTTTTPIPGLLRP